MSYEVTATRRRPQKFDDLVGQEFVAQTLKNSIKSGKIAHAYLFSGPRGCGKTSTARILAKALNCQNGPTDCPCGTCSNCQEITKGSSFDVIEIDGASNTSVDNIRQIKDEVLFPPSNSRYKIYIIDEVHMLSNSAFNALLKTIEEPPEYIIFIFATTELQEVPATIKSRCQQFNFRLVSIDKVKDCLADAARELGIEADDEALFWIARESTGSMRDAYTLFDQVVAFSEGHITYDKIRNKLGLVGVDRLNAIFEACVQSKTDTVLNYLDEFLQAGISIEQLISNCADYLRSLLLIKSGVTKESLLGNSADRYSALVLNNWNTIQVERALSIYLQLYRDIRYSLSPRYELELSFSRLCWLSQYVSNMEVKKAIDAAQALLLGNAQNAAPVKIQAQISPSYSAAPVEVAPPQPVQEKEVENPNGMPRLSMLDNPNFGNEENSNPFYNGGSLPPEQSVNNTQPVESAAPKVVNEKLVLNIPQNHISADGLVIPTAMTGSNESFSYNPDSEDEEWTNTDNPPEENYYTEGDYEKKAEQAYEAFTNPNQSSPSSVQLNKSFTTADNRVLSIAQLKGNVIATLSVKNSFLANSLSTTEVWTVKTDFVEAEIENEFDKVRIEQNISEINEIISGIVGKPMPLKLVPKKNESGGGKNEIPPQILAIKDMFRGEIIAGKM